MAEADPFIPEIILFEHPNFHGRHKHIFVDEVKNLADVGEPDATHFADRTSSIVVVKGTWLIYEDKNFLENERQLGPGRYPDVEKVGLHNERISSLKRKKTSP